MKIVDLSDLHFGNKLVNSEHMYTSLVEYAYPVILKSNMVIISGDLFHSLIDLNHTASHFVIRFINDLVTMSIEHGIKIRLLRGTFTHDRNQLLYIQSHICEVVSSGRADIKIYDKISIDEECIADERLSICYLPDDLPYNSEEDVLDIVRKLLASRKMDKVDIVIGHGYCKHVLPYGVTGPPVTYTLDGLASICKHVAIFGHIHTPSIKKTSNITVVYVGSMERMNHGEEEKKGFIVLDTSNWTTKFIENKNTLVFSTYRSTISDIETVVESFLKWMSTVPLRMDNPNYIRVIHESREVRQLLGKLVADMFKDYKCIYTSKKASDDKTFISDTDISTDAPSLVIPTEDNIVELLKIHIDNDIAITDKLPIETIEKLWKLNFDGDTHDIVTT